jgi:adenosylhomocysteine nucleosidase
LVGAGREVWLSLKKLMRILVTFAVEAEFAPWRKLRQFQRIVSANMECFCSRVGEAEVTVLLTGIGCKKAWVEAAKVLSDGGVDICVSSGLAGGLRAEHTAGEVLVANQVLASKSDRVVHCDPLLVGSAVASGAKGVRAFYTTDRVVLLAVEKNKLGAFADAVEMESGEILYEAAAFGARVVAIRAISDTADEDLPIDFNKVSTEEGNVSIRRIMGKVMVAPRKIPSLIRFGKQSSRAAQSLAEFLERFVPTVVASIEPVARSSGALS